MKGLLILFAVMSGPTVYAEGILPLSCICGLAGEVCFDGTVRWIRINLLISIKRQMVNAPKGCPAIYFLWGPGPGETVVRYRNRFPWGGS